MNTSVWANLNSGNTFCFIYLKKTIKNFYFQFTKFLNLHDFLCPNYLNYRALPNHNTDTILTILTPHASFLFKMRKWLFGIFWPTICFFFGTRSRLKVSIYKRPRSKPVSHIEFPGKITKNRSFWWLGCRIHQNGEEGRAPLLYCGLKKIGKIIVFFKQRNQLISINRLV